MNRRSRLYRTGLMSGLGALVAATALLAVPSQAARADTGCDCWIVTPTSANPATAPAGTSEIYSFTVTNDDPNETLEQLTFTAPSGFVITGVPVSPAGTMLSALPDSSVTLTLHSNAGSSFNVEIQVSAPCTTASGTWSLSDKDSLDNNEAIWSSSPLSVSVTGQCSLKFTGEPAAQTAVNSDIKTGVGSTGNPLAVQIFDAGNNPLNPADSSASGTEVTVSILANPGNATLSGTTTVPTSGGVADFADLRINQPDAGYTLAAAATGFTSVPSNSFTISQVVQLCGATCTASPPPTATTATSFTTTSASGDFAALSLSSPALTCNHYTAVSDMADFGIFASSGSPVGTASAIATLTISKSAVESSPRPLIFWQICYGSPTPFPSVPGTSGTTVIGGVTYHTGLLLSCIFFSPAHPEPCLISQRYTSEGAVQLEFVALGDPIYRG
jgi:hypothetical protein